MNKVKENFSIRDLENLSGIKAHTIRIWEKRYNLLQPERTDTNIRTYDIKNLQKLLNVTLLYNNGFKISKIAELPESEIPIIVRETIAENSENNHAINAFKLAMVNFDQSLFFSTYDHLIAKRSFRQVFYEVFIPLMDELGLLWQTDAISPSHEHFVTHLIKQKVFTNIEVIQKNEPKNTDKIFVLYLPENEIHELGLLYLNYEIALRGYKTIYLGQSMPIKSMADLKRYYNNLYFVSYFTIEPTKDNLTNYIDRFSLELNEDGKSKLWVLGRMVQHLQNMELPANVKTFNSIEKLISAI